jgi:hypothetical protein
MPGNTWKDLRKETSPFSTGYSASRPRRIGNVERENAIERARKTSPQLAGLLDERKVLEGRLRNLSGGSGEVLDARDAARFRVPTFAERRAQQREWESKHERLRTRAAALRNLARNRATALQNTGTLQQMRSAEISVSQWLARRDKQRQNLRQSARDRLSPLKDVAQVGRKLSDSLSSASGQLRDLDRQLAEQGLSQEREELRKSGAGRLTKVQSKVDRYTKMAEAPMRTVDKIDDFWNKRQQQISGAMDKAGPYFERANQRLSTETGGSGNLFERLQRNRELALQRRLEKRRDEVRDEARRQRASRRKADRDKAGRDNARRDNARGSK